MTKKKSLSTVNKYCLWFLCLFIVSGCATESKRDQIVGIQKVRIKKLEKQLKQQNKIIAQLKAKKWIKAPVKKSASRALKPLKTLINNNQWVAALKLSSTLKQQYPRSRKLARYRVKIFKKMGLEKQAMDELKSLKKMKARTKKRSRRI